MSAALFSFIGRFQQSDPYQASGGAGAPQSWNRYSYVENDPIHNVDPTGLMLGPPGVEPDPCSGGSVAPPPPEPETRPSCSIGFRTEGSPIGGYNHNGSGLTPSVNPNTTPLGGGLSGVYGFYYFEIIVTTFGSTNIQSDWTFRQDTIQRVDYIFRRGRGRGAFSETEFDESIPDVWPPMNEQWRGSLFIWYDTPALLYPANKSAYDEKTNTVYSASFARSKWSFTFTAKHKSGAFCQRHLTLNLEWDVRAETMRWWFTP